MVVVVFNPALVVDKADREDSVAAIKVVADMVANKVEAAMADKEVTEALVLVLLPLPVPMPKLEDSKSSLIFCICFNFSTILNVSDNKNGFFLQWKKIGQPQRQPTGNIVFFC